MDYTIRKSVRAKRMRLSMDSSGALTLVLPKFMPELAGRVFVQSQKKWIERQRSKVELKVENYLQQEIVTGSSIFIFDQKYYSIKIEPTNLIRDSFKVDSEYLVLKLSTKNKKSKQLRIKVLIEKFYRQKAKDYLTEASFFWAQKLGASFNDVRIKSTKTRWGSCSSNKNLNYNWRIMQAPEAVVNYLVIHEVCHLKQMNHSARFWNLVESLDPNFKVHQKYLKDNQDRLLGFLS